MEQHELFSIHYVDKATASLVYKKLLETAESIGLISCGLEKFKSRGNRSYKIVLTVTSETGKNLPAILRGVKDSLREHPLFSYLNFDSHTIPLSRVGWNFDSYDDPEFQKIFIRKRKDL